MKKKTKKMSSFLLVWFLVADSTQKKYQLVTSNGQPSDPPYLTFLSKFKEQCISICGTTPKCYSYTLKQTVSSNQYECQFYTNQTWGQNLVPSLGVRYYFINLRDCKDWYALGARVSGVYKINWMGRFFKDVRCNMEIDGGGWIVFQRRFKATALDFYHRSWSEYKSGFGDPDQELWLGNDFLHEMSSSKNHDILIYARNWDGSATTTSRYASFYIDNENNYYTIHFDETQLGNHNSLSSSLAKQNVNGMQFQTLDRRNDGSFPCAAGHGPFWSNSCAGIDPNRRDWIRWAQYAGNQQSIEEIQMMFKA